MSVVGTRKIVFENFRNLGVYGSEQAETRLDLGVIRTDGLGGLLCLIGANNEGKSNVLEGIAEWGEGKLADRDRPDFGVETGEPKVRLEYSIKTKNPTKEEIQKAREELFKKTFIFTFSPHAKEMAHDRLKFVTHDSDKAYQEAFCEPVEVVYGANDKGEAIFIQLSEKFGGLIFTCIIDKSFCVRVNNKDVNDKNDKKREIVTEHIRQTGIKVKVIEPHDRYQYQDSGDYGDLSDLRKLLELLGSFALEEEQSLPKEKMAIFKKELSLSGWTQADKIPQGIGTDFPKVFFYREQKLKDQDLKITYREMEQSAFFQMLFKILDTQLLEKVKTAYEKSKEGSKNALKQIKMDIRKLVSKKINDPFNKLYRFYEQEQTYTFDVDLESSGYMEFCIYKDETIVSLSHQSTGFQKFFHFFFNFLYKDEIGEGDIVLIDEPENSLSVPAQREFRSFLRDFGRKQGIIFIVSTHSPFMLDMDHLDEVRMIVRNTKRESKGSWIANNFSTLNYGQVDTLKKLCEALGISKISLKDEQVIFVEGIMDYNIFSAYQQTYTKDKPFTFLPIGGLGQDDGKEREVKIKALVHFIKEMDIHHPLLLVDGDQAGEEIKKEAQKQGVVAITLKEALGRSEQKITLESLFDLEDRQKFGFQDCKKLGVAGVVSSAFKSVLELQLESMPKNLDTLLAKDTQDNLNALFTFLEDRLNSPLAKS
ncbi:AAA family ATPase [Helicobacter cynogastricus]|uniref:AAA family ATPase n=1 Tax=Helicobacter cynogastricus TaxID=329937 RepID=UPI000CF12AC4|nr:AAA family ATPase [Helicobacter cynogastricus]